LGGERKAEKKGLKNTVLPEKKLCKVEPKEGVVAKESRPTEKKPLTSVGKGKMLWGYLRRWPDSTHLSLKGIKE
jgi:hypothetical protein